jgi:hypothetical protein
MYFVQAIEVYAVWRKIVQLSSGRTDGPDSTGIQISTQVYILLRNKCNCLSTWVQKENRNILKGT